MPEFRVRVENEFVVKADDELHLDRLKEGLCPRHGTPLERRDDNGWCDECGTGWSLRGDEVRIHMEFLGGDIDGKPLGPGTARFTVKPQPSGDNRVVVRGGDGSMPGHPRMKAENNPLRLVWRQGRQEQSGHDLSQVSEEGDGLDGSR